MKIAIEAMGIDRFGGGRTATLTLLEALFSLDSKNDYCVILTAAEPSLSRFPNVRQWIASIRNRFAARMWAQLSLPWRLRHFDVVHFAKNLTVFGLAPATVVTVYDLTPLVNPELFPKSDVLYW